ncbi:DUF2789 domain-containing protein [Shewanella waksmanii]|uniref:DUF2789 domain-containing protein n=1 Tax=Shewanella waksmanii TaxID=213783 RepID=UPI003736CFF2
MDTNTPDLALLFKQLGLDNQQEAIDNFIATHSLAPTATLAEAPFWSDAQQAFISEAIAEDAQWSEVIDQLDTLLRRR